MQGEVLKSKTSNSCQILRAFGKGPAGYDPAASRLDLNPLHPVMVSLVGADTPLGWKSPRKRLGLSMYINEFDRSQRLAFLPCV
jgi:hypothetical protein